MMPLPWLRILEAVIGVTDIARSRRTGKVRAESESQQLEAAAQKEAFERDTRRVDLERERMEAEQRRAERAQRLELLRQAGDREIDRLRLIAGIAVATWIGTLFFVARLASAAVGARFTFGVGWMLLLGAIASSFSAQARIGRDLGRPADTPERNVPGSPTSDIAGAAAIWLLVAALALIGLVALVA